MIQCNSFELVYLRKIPYLIPYGQQTANLQKSVRLNETGVLIWINFGSGTIKNYKIELSGILTRFYRIS